MENNYKGLANIGSTCYMNSLLQTLYMTPEFRQSIYNWQYDEKIHPAPQNSIIYQLQRLFGKLESKYPGEVSTKDLVKSFQWEDQQAHLQQDIQQFNRVLFEALEKSLLGKKKQLENENRSHFMRDLYEGSMVSYTKCSECLYQSQREELFQDVIVNIKSTHEKVYNSSVQLALQRYMKPEYLDQNNLYECSGCGNKVQAERGVRFLKMPKLLNIIFRRFDFDYFTFQKVKVNDRISFPYILNINDYMNGYANIKRKLDEDSSGYFLNQNVPAKKMPKSTTTGMKKVVKKPPTIVPGKKAIKSNPNTKAFLEEMRRKKMMSQQPSDHDEFYVSGSAPMNQPSMEKKVQSTREEKKVDVEVEEQKRKLSKSEPSSQQINIEEINSKKEESQKKQESTEPSVKVQNKKEIPLPPPPPPPLDLPPPTLSEPYKPGEKTEISISAELAERINEKKALEQARNEESRLANQKHIKQEIEKYIEQGPLLYQLYSVLVHSGTANHGHYYSYIKSFEDNRWYCFNDERVYEVGVAEVEKTFGGGAIFANAYALSYRVVEKQKKKYEGSKIPTYIEKLLEEEMQQMKNRQKQRLIDLENIITLKIHYQLFVKQLEIHKNSPLALCLDKAREMFDITDQSIKKHNTRLRMFNAVTESKLDTFTGKENQSLLDLKIGSFKSLLLQTKKEEEVFDQYIPGMKLRLVLWEESGSNLKSLDENHLKLHTIVVPYNSKMTVIEKSLKNKRKQLLDLEDENSPILVVKRHQNDEHSYHQFVNEASYLPKTTQELLINENQILFIEPFSQVSMWAIQFENQLYRITIKFNTLDNQMNDYMTDSRKTIKELKKQLSEFLGHDMNDLIMRRGTKSGMQIKNLQQTMKDAKFITGTQLYFEKGIPAKAGEIRVQLYMAVDAPAQFFNRLHLCEFVADVPVNKQSKASQVKQLFMDVMQKYKGIELEKEKFRIRERANEKLGKIYRERPMRDQQLIEKRQIAIENVPENLDMKQNSIYVRIWDPQNWTLSSKLQIIVSKTTSMIELAALVYAQDQSVQMQEMQICRILSIHKFNILDLCDMEYYDMTEASVYAEPLFVNTDGLLYIVKKVGLNPRPLTREEEIKFGGTVKEFSRRYRPRTNVAKKERGVTIKVVQKQDEKKEEIEPLKKQNLKKEQQKSPEEKKL